MKYTIYGRLSGLNEYVNANRHNRYKGASMKKEAESLISAYLTPVVHFKKLVHIQFDWYEKNKQRDKDNIASAKKFIFDALVKKGILEGDGWKHVDGFTDNFYIDKDNPRIEITITEVGNESRERY